MRSTLLWAAIVATVMLPFAPPKAKAEAQAPAACAPSACSAQAHRA